MEIVSTVLDDEEANKYLLSLKEADNKAGHILKTITQLKNEILVLETVRNFVELLLTNVRRLS